MNPYIKRLNAWLAENQPNYDCLGIRSLLEHLWSSYTSYNPIVNDKIKEQLATLQPILDKLTIADADKLFDLVADLCLEHERLAFLEGIHVGARLADELAATL